MASQRGADPLSGSHAEAHRLSRPAEERKNGEVTQEGDCRLVICACGASPDGLGESSPCPYLGSTANIVHVSSHDRAGVADESVGITALYEKQRPWQKRWQEVQAAYHAVTGVYSGNVSGGADEWKDIALSFFRLCHELSEAITSDSTVRTPTKRAIRTVAGRRNVLRLVADVDNTRKHGGRDPDKCHAHIGEISWGSHDTPTMTVLRECPDSGVERFDVRDSATAAMDAWRAILSLNGLTP